MHVIEQELGTLRQGGLTLLQYYDEVEKKLTLLTIKVNMTYEAAMVKVLCDKAQPHGCAFLGKTQRHADSSRLGAGSRIQPLEIHLRNNVCKEPRG